MIVSKANLVVVDVTRDDKMIPVLNNVLFNPDGSTVGSSGRCMLTVSPVPVQTRKAVPLDETLMDEEELCINADMIKEVLKNMPKDSMFKGLLEHCDVGLDPERDSQAVATLTDGKRTRVISGKRWERKYLTYRAVFKQVQESKDGHRVVLNLRRLLSLLAAIDKACPDSSGNNPVFIEFSKENDILVRAYSPGTGQRAVGVMSTYKGEEGNWFEPDAWERGLGEGPVSVDGGGMDSLGGAGIDQREAENQRAAIPKRKGPPIRAMGGGTGDVGPVLKQKIGAAVLKPKEE